MLQPFIKIFLALILIITVIGCSSESEGEIIAMEKVTDSGKNFSIEDLKKIGFKENKEYKIKKLPGAISAYFGFIKNDLKGPEDYEIRFYSNHDEAVKLGIKYADNIVSENACVKKECSLWLENLNQRQQIDGGPSIMESMAGTRNAKYKSYVIYNNLILFCPGNNEDDSMKNCTIVIDKLERK